MSLSSRILIGLAIGIAIGLFFGERAMVLDGAATAFIGLLQMTVLPYLVVALVYGLGRLSPQDAVRLAKYGGVTLVILWIVTLSVVSSMPLGFPSYESASFFSTTLIEPAPPISFIDLYIPANPFSSLADNVVPAVTLFSAVLGVALIGIDDKDRILEPLGSLMKALSRVSWFVTNLTPYGMVAIAAVVAGTMSPADFLRLEVYFIAFIAAALLLGLVLLPLLVVALTPFRYSEVVQAGRDAMLTAFLTSNVFVVLPIIAERCEQLAVEHGIGRDTAYSAPRITTPIAFNFPTAGKLLTLLFVPFAAWFSGKPLEWTQYPELMFAGLFSYFAKAQVALPFLLDLEQLPQDMVRLYVPTALLNGKFDSAVGAMSLLAFSLITTAALAGRVAFRGRSLLGFCGVGGAATLGTVVLVAGVLEVAFDTRYTRDEALLQMHLSSAPDTVCRAESGRPEPDAALDSLARIRARGALRVGYRPDSLPFAFVNANDQLVGFDVEMALQMADNLDVCAEFIVVNGDEIDTALSSGRVDLVLGVPYSPHWIERTWLSVPYAEGTVGLLVRDERRDDFATLQSLRRQTSLTIGGFVDHELYENYAGALLGDAPHELVELSSWADYFDGAYPEIDAVVVMAEIGMAWSLIHPEYSVVIPREAVIRRPLAFAMAPGAHTLLRFVDQWVRLQQARGAIERSYDYWILGHGAEERQPRWSIARDVLGWFD